MRKVRKNLKNSQSDQIKLTCKKMNLKSRRNLINIKSGMNRVVRDRPNVIGITQNKNVKITNCENVFIV